MGFNVVMHLLLVRDLRRSRNLGARDPTADSTGLGLAVSHPDELGDYPLNLLVAFHEPSPISALRVMIPPVNASSRRLGITVPCGAWARRAAPRAAAPGEAGGRRSSNEPGARWSGSSGGSPTAPAGRSPDGSPNRRSRSAAGPSHTTFLNYNYPTGTTSQDYVT